MSERSPYYLEQRQIQAFLPHRYPFLMVDRILEITGPGPLDEESPKSRIGIKVTGVKNVTMNEPYFTGHFPELPIMPGVQIVEAMAQVGSILMLNKPGRAGRIGYFMSADAVKFRKPVVPGDTLFIEVELVQQKRNIAKAKGRCLVNQEVVSEAELMFGLVDR
jgi:UDP-3-O-[3-hydroxymyristoyl] N-acetylglucosamine deacetylase/3-hydroxyacyl-[acyl-carrier-protein] dehydratase